jgi:hypothetical protein
MHDGLGLSIAYTDPVRDACTDEFNELLPDAHKHYYPGKGGSRTAMKVMLSDPCGDLEQLKSGVSYPEILRRAREAAGLPEPDPAGPGGRMGFAYPPREPVAAPLDTSPGIAPGAIPGFIAAGALLPLTLFGVYWFFLRKR